MDISKLFGFSNSLSWCLLEGAGENVDLQVVLSSDVTKGPRDPGMHPLTQQDALEEVLHGSEAYRSNSNRHLVECTTSRERDVKSRLRLPWLRRYPVPPGCTETDDEETRRAELLVIYQAFVLELHKGVQMTQMTPNQEYSLIHLQILEDLQTLQVDQGSGCIIEFPLRAVSKVYRIVKCEDRWLSAGGNGSTPMPPLPLTQNEHIVVVEFMKRKLAFVFGSITEAANFLTCMELLVYRAQECADEASSWKSSKPKEISPMFSRYPGKAGVLPADTSNTIAKTVIDPLKPPL